MLSPHVSPAPAQGCPCLLGQPGALLPGPAQCRAGGQGTEGAVGQHLQHHWPHQGPCETHALLSSFLSCSLWPSYTCHGSDLYNASSTNFLKHRQTMPRPPQSLPAAPSSLAQASRPLYPKPFPGFVPYPDSPWVLWPPRRHPTPPHLRAILTCPRGLFSKHRHSAQASEGLGGHSLARDPSRKRGPGQGHV